MGQNAVFDPKKRDWMLENGSLFTTNDIDVAAYLILTIPNQNWLYAEAGDGSDLYRFRNAKRTSAVEQAFAARVKQALNSQLVALGRATKVDVINAEATRTGTSNEIRVTPSRQLSNPNILWEPT